MVKQFIKFGIVGGVNTVLSLLIYWICVGVDIHYFLANAIAFLFTVAISYVLNNIFTFREGKEAPVWSITALFKVYASYFATGIVLNTAMLWFWTDCIGIDKNISPVINLLITIPLNFVINKYWVYRKDN